MSRRLEVDVESGEGLDLGLGLGFLTMLEIIAGLCGNGNDPGGVQKLV